MTNRNPLTLDEHRQLSQVLANIRYDLREHTGVYKKYSSTDNKLKKARSTLQQLAEHLEDLVVKDHPKNTRFIYVSEGRSEGRSFDALYECLDKAVLKIINGRVPAKIIDQGLKCERVFWMLKIFERDKDDEKDSCKDF